MNETPGTLRTLLARRDGELVAIEPWVIAWEADIAKREALEKMMASQDELNHNLVDRNEALERAMSAIECCECGHDLLHCTCLGGLCFEEKASNTNCVVGDGGEEIE